jgi:hypothetical protein
MLGVYTFQHETNRLALIQDVYSRIGYSRSITERCLLKLISLDLIVTSPGVWNRLLYNVTMKGEYVIRAYQIEVSRLMNDTPLSKWNRIKDKEDVRNKFLRKPTTKGSKLY